MERAVVGRSKPPSSAEKTVLAALLHLKGTWSDTSGWVWESRHWTVVLLNSLARKNLVREVVANHQYELTPDGEKLARTLPQAAVRRPAGTDAALYRQKESRLLSQLLAGLAPHLQTGPGNSER